MARVGEELKKSRLEANMSMKQVAKKLGVSESFVNEVELGRRIVNEDLIKRFSKVFNKKIGSMGLDRWRSLHSRNPLKEPRKSSRRKSMWRQRRQ